MNKPTQTSPPRPPRSILKDADISPQQLNQLLNVATYLKAERAKNNQPKRLTGKTIALLFEKPSTRTRTAFEIAIYEQGGQCTYIDPSSSHLGISESIEDTAHVLGNLYDGIAFRGFLHSDIESLSQNAGVPVWNGLTDKWHPTQALADILTIREHTRKPLTDTSVCFLGDARDNVANSLLTSAMLAGMDVRIACPASLRPEPDVIATALEIGHSTGGRLLITDDIDQAIAQTDFLYTDVWVSMGEPRDQWADRVPLLRPFRIDQALLNRTKNSAVKFMHCLPAIHNQDSQIGRELFSEYGLNGAEVEDAVFRTANSIVFKQAENRMHTIKAVMLGSLNRLQPTLDEA